MSAPVPLRLRPLEIGDLLDETFRMYRRHFFLFAGISVALAIPFAALAGYSIYAVFNGFLSQLATGQNPDYNSFVQSTWTLALGLLVYLALYPLLYAITYAVCMSAMGQPVTVWSALRGALRRYPQIAGYLLLQVLMVVLFCLFPLWIWIWIGWVAVVPVMFVENTGLVAAMRRSWYLVQGRWWRTFLIVFLVVILLQIVQGALIAFVNLGQFLLAIFLNPYLVSALTEVVSILVSALVTPVFQIAIVLIYFDLRVRREALDLFQLAQRVAAPQPAG